MTPFTDKKIVLTVTGGIAAYKAADLARSLVKAEAQVRTAMTPSAERFITALTMQTLTGHPVYNDLWAADRPGEVAHISLADWAEVVVIAPATANIIAKLANGLADDFVSTFLLAVRGPVVVCPSMNVNMLEHPAVQANLARLKQYYRVVEPESGALACGWEGKGRLPGVDIIMEETLAALTKQDMAGLTVMVTAGPTREAWDGIRYISNRSSGRMGLSLAKEARRRGARVILVAGPVDFPPPYGVETIHVESTRQMREAVLENIDRVGILIKAAAPGDFRPARLVAGKLKKAAIPEPIELARNPDILMELGREKGDLVLVGFAAESDDLIERAKAKMAAKNLDLMVANQIGRPGEAFGAETNRVWILDPAGEIEEAPLMSKDDVARRIWDKTLAVSARRRGANG